MKKHKKLLYMFLIALAIGIFVVMKNDPVMGGLPEKIGYVTGFAVSLVAVSVAIGGIVNLIYSSLKKTPFMDTFYRITGILFWIMVAVAVIAYK